MRNHLQQGSELILHEQNTENSYRLRILENLGSGAVCIAYLAADCSNAGLRYIVKECCPVKGSSRESGSAVLWNEAEAKETYLARFRHAYEMQICLQNNADTSEDLAHITHGLMEANDTLYMLIDPRAAIAYDDLPRERTLQDIFRTAKALAEAVGAQHRAGYLNLDIKPSNIMVVPGRPDTVLLLDFDSLVEKQAAVSAPSSYSPEFAAPEQLQHKLKKISEATDIYAIGAVVFSRIFGRSPAAADRSIFSDWELDENPLFISLSSKTKRLTRELFHKTLSASPKSRLQNMAVLSKLLDDLILESDPVRRHLVGICPDPTNIFVGREEELRRIHDAFSSGNRLVFITGMGGIGKTELAKNYAKRYKADYDVICYGDYEDSIVSLFADDDFIHVENDSEGTVTVKSVKELLDERVLLIIDNCSFDPDAPEDRDFDRLLSCRCNIMLITRFRPENLYESAEVVDLSDKTLSADEQLQLFEKEYGESLKEEDIPIVENILSSVKGYTLLIPLLAKQMARGSLSAGEILSRITSYGVTDISSVRVRHRKDRSSFSASLDMILKNVLDMSGLTEKERYVLDCFAILKGFKVYRETILGWIGEDYANTINDLIDYHWLLCTGSGMKAKLSVHDVIRDVLKSDTEHKIDTAWIKSIADEYVDSLSKFICKHKIACTEPDFLEKNNPDRLFFVDVLFSIRDENLVQFEKKRNLIGALLDSLSVENNAEQIIDIYLRIVRFENFIHSIKLDNDLDYLRAIRDAAASNSLSATKGAELSYLLTLFSLKKLCLYSTDPHLEHEQLPTQACEICEEITLNLRETVECVLVEPASYNLLVSLYSEMADAVRAFGCSIFVLWENGFSKEASNIYSGCVNSLFAMLISTFSGSLTDKDKEKYRLQLSEFNDLINAGKYYGAYHDDFYDDFVDDSNEILPFSEVDKETTEIFHKVQNLGFRITSTPEKYDEINILSLTAADKIAEAENLMFEAVEKWKMVYGSDFSIDDLGWGDDSPFREWDTVLCLFFCCKNEFDRALKHYESYLSSYWCSNTGLVEMDTYCTVQYLGFHDLAAQILKMNILFQENDLKKYNLPETQANFEILQSILRNAELAGDVKRIEKYSSLIEQMTDTGFTIE